MLILEEALTERAKVWLDARSEPFENYNSFKEAFLQKYYSLPAKLELKDAWSSKKFRHTDKSLHDYFMSQVHEAKYVAPEMNVAEINCDAGVASELL